MKFLSWSSWIFRRTVTCRSVPTNSTAGRCFSQRPAKLIAGKIAAHRLLCAFCYDESTKNILQTADRQNRFSHKHTSVYNIYIYTRFYNELIKGLSSQPLTISPIAPKICHRWWPPAGSVAVPNRHRPAMPRASLETPRPLKASHDRHQVYRCI